MNRMMALGALCALAASGYAAENVEQPPVTPPAHVEIRGTGPVPMVLIPGLACDWTVWDSFMSRNEGAYTMYAVTLPGFAGSDPPPTPPEDAKFGDGPWLANAERAVVQLVEEKGLARPVVVGHSLGGHLAMRLAAEHPGMFRSAVAVDGMPAFPLSGPGIEMTREQRETFASTMFRSMSATPDEAWRTQQKQWVMQMVTDPTRGESIAAMNARTPKTVVCRYMAELLAADITAEVKKSETPILMVAAVAPSGTPGSSAESVRTIWTSFSEGTKTVNVVYFEDSRHFVMDDAPEKLDRVMERWVKGEPVEEKKAEAQE